MKRGNMNPYMQYAEKLNQSTVKETIEWGIEEATDFEGNSLTHKIGGVPERRVFFVDLQNADQQNLNLIDKVREAFKARYVHLKARHTHVIPAPYTIPTEVKEKYAQKGIDLVGQTQK